MKTTTLNFYERVALSEIVGQQEGRLADISAYLRILERIRLTDNERKASNLRVQGGQLLWKLPEEGFGAIKVEFEDEEARRLVQLLETWPKIAMRDAPWIERVVADLKCDAPAKASKRKGERLCA